MKGLPRRVHKQCRKGSEKPRFGRVGGGQKREKTGACKYHESLSDPEGRPGFRTSAKKRRSLVPDELRGKKVSAEVKGVYSKNIKDESQPLWGACSCFYAYAPGEEKALTLTGWERKQPKKKKGLGVFFSFASYSEKKREY